MLRADGVRVAIKGIVILRNVSLEVPRGGLIGLAGRNGAGKTTTLKSIMGILPAAGGTIALDGVDLLSVPAHRRAGLGIGYMPEDRRLIGTLTVEDNILMPAWAGRLSTTRERLSYIYGVMAPVAAMAGRHASALSGGQQKLVALARALMTGTKLLLLDEPFEGLAPAMGQRLTETILQLRKDGASVLIAESDLNRISFADAIYTIERGEIVQRSPSK
jgi:branched-chain amino acid transport system ATP-binding protein